MKNLKYAMLLSGLAALSGVQADDGSMPTKKSSASMMSEQGEIMAPGSMMAGYNAPAAYKVNGWDVYLTGSFLYWTAASEGWTYGKTVTYDLNGAPESPTPGFGEVLYIDGEYRPGFKVGIGTTVCSEDQWSLYGEYTWFQQTFKDGFLSLVDGEGVQLSSQSNNNSGMTVASADVEKVKLHLNLFDLVMTRPYYAGQHVVMSPFFGLRGTWFKQHRFTDAVMVPTTDVDSPANPLTNNTAADSWRIGPRVGCTGSWLLGLGFRLIGTAAASVGYERYTTLHQKESRLDDSLTTANIPADMREFGTVRVDTELDIGLGWGSYFYGQDYHIDLAATYDFNVFWNGEMTRFLQDTAASVTGASPANLYLHGLTVKARFDF